MAEMIIPGTHIDARAEGLISAARVATGIVVRELVTSKTDIPHSPGHFHE